MPARLLNPFFKINHLKGFAGDLCFRLQTNTNPKLHFITLGLLQNFTYHLQHSQVWHKISKTIV